MDESSATQFAGYPNTGVARDPADDPVSAKRYDQGPDLETEPLDSTLEMDRLLGRVSEMARHRFAYDSFAILLFDPVEEELRIRFGDGYPQEFIDEGRLEPGQGLVGTALKTGKAVRIGNVAQDQRYIDVVKDTCSELAVPLLVDDRAIGVIDLGSRRDHFYTLHQERDLVEFAKRISGPIENARLYESLREQARTLSILHQASQELSSVLDREVLLARIAKLVKGLIDYQLFAVMLWNEDTQLLDHVFSLRFDERFQVKPGFPLGHGITGTAALLRKPLRIPDIRRDPRYVTCGHGVEVRSELVVPLLLEDRLIGVVDLESIYCNAFRARHERMLSTLGASMAIALENARLYEKLRADEARLERDLAMAREVQKSLLPEHPGGIDGLQIGVGYRSARELGGDLYDFLPYPDGRLAIAVADVSGKSTPAALYGSLAVGILRGHVVEHPCEPAEMLCHMNRHLYKSRIDGRFVAMAFGIFDVRQKTLTLANSGFPKPFLCRRSKVEEIPVVGIPLGLFANTRYDQVTLSLQEGDVVAFCSDGLHESTNERGEEYGADRLKSVVAELLEGTAQEIADGLLNVTRNHAGSESGRDDRTVVVLKVIGTRESDSPS